MKQVIELKKVSKKYDKFSLENINLTIPSGCIVGLVGENGAGKTTLIKAILNLINYEGTINLFGKNNHEDYLKDDIGIVLDNMFFSEILNAQEIDKIMQDIYHNWQSDLFFKYLEDFSLSKKKMIKTFSKGMKKKLELAVALAHEPKLLILDEPTSGLDPVIRKELQEIFLNFIKDEDHTIFISTHITSDLETIADAIVFIDQGKIILDIDKDTLMDSYGILKCSGDDFKNISKEDIIKYQKNKYGYEILINDKDKLKKKYPDAIIDKITLEDLMYLMIKGEE